MTAARVPAEQKDYDELRHRALVPRLLVVLLLPVDAGQWIEQDDERMLSRQAAYYVSLSGMAATAHRSKVPVHLPRQNLLTVDALRRLMAAASQRKRKL